MDYNPLTMAARDREIATGSHDGVTVTGSSDLGVPAAGIDELRGAILACRVCATAPRRTPLPHTPRPILRVSPRARLVIASQAPGARAHASGVPFDDPSGVRLRAWMGLDEATFYDGDRVAIVPMGFCFPGHDASKGDLPPRGECRPLWHDRIFSALPQVELIVTIGLHAMRYHMNRLDVTPSGAASMADLVARWRDFAGRPVPRLLPLPHPSWRNSAWLKRNPWFEADVLPVLRAEVRRLTA